MTKPMPSKEELLQLNTRPLREIAIKYNVSIGTARRWFRVYDIKLKDSRITPMPSMDELWRMEAYSLREICRKYNVSHKTVKKWLKDNVEIARKNRLSRSKSILRARMAGVPVTGIAKEFGLSESSIYRICNGAKPNLKKDEKVLTK